ncbi:MAG: protein-L-isoaspartate O-methyltransferase [Rhodospirillales bacterium]|nr:protein-L-isoaspartate O-methyltransferase [Rhodospirillales bacterium]MCB9995752.1 protein-L-isoaspartate O-methyltransferase [Rhodospirillales bacterium]
MTQYAQARKNMLDCQLAPNGITEQAVLDAFETVPRELFLPESRRNVAYLDEDLPLDNGSFFMEPVVFARMVQAARPGSDDTVLNIGDITGYSSAILSNLVSTVVALEPKPGTFDPARKIWDEMNYCNIAVVKGEAASGSPEHAPYSVIFVNGAVAEIPQGLLDQLAVHGHLVAVVREKESGMGCITVIEKEGDNHFSTARLYDAATPYAQGFEPAQDFVF